MKNRLVRRLHDWGITEAEELADYLFANGIVIMPCKVGDKVYVICNKEVQEATVFSMSMETENNNYVFYIKAKAIDGTIKSVDGYVPVFAKFIFGKTAFLTKEEAERALKWRN